ncbi:MAG: flagellar hook capping FlgD N-terminal domain-containing protein [Pseudobdellovibrio sp.]
MATSIGMKVGTKTWNEKPKAEEDIKTVSTLSDAQKERLGEDDVGAVLNKAANPNWVNPSRQVKGVGNSQLDKDAFFKLMLTQLKNQDPTNPLKNHEMAAQLAQFSTLEQMSNMNTTLTKIEGKNKDPENFQALNLIGKTVAGDSSKVVRTPFDSNHDFNFNLTADAADAKIKVLDDKNNTVREYKLNNLRAGPNKINWNGMNDKGEKAASGEFQFQIEAMGAGGQKLQVKTEFQGVISGLSFSPEGPVLQVGKQTVKMRDVRQITDPSLMSNDQNVKDVTNLDLKNKDDMSHTGNTEEAKTSTRVVKAESSNANAPKSNVMTDVAMSRDLMNKLQKETK